MPVGQRLAYAAVWRRALQRQLGTMQLQGACSIEVLAANRPLSRAVLAEIGRDGDYCRPSGRSIGGIRGAPRP
jgi:hypothetical protein